MLLLYRLLFQALIIAARIENLNSLTTFFLFLAVQFLSLLHNNMTVCVLMWLQLEKTFFPVTLMDVMISMKFATFFK